jgi:hypothetical protein
LGSSGSAGTRAMGGGCAPAESNGCRRRTPPRPPRRSRWQDAVDHRRPVPAHFDGNSARASSRRSRARARPPPPRDRSCWPPRPRCRSRPARPAAAGTTHGLRRDRVPAHSVRPTCRRGRALSVSSRSVITP